MPKILLCRLLKRSKCRIRVRNFGELEFRLRGSDLEVLRQIFRDHHYDLSRFTQNGKILTRYRAILKSGRVPVIIDAGANIGAASIYFASQYPEATVVAVEPEIKNFELCKRNAAQFQNVAALQAALGATAGTAEIVNPDTSSWCFQTERADAGSIMVRTIPDLVESIPLGSLFAVKMDIEGFEADVFTTNCTWLDEVTLLIVEPHDWMLEGKKTSRPLQRAIAERDFDILVAGENLVYVRSS